jgi:hypothetical protein
MSASGIRVASTLARLYDQGGLVEEGAQDHGEAGDRGPGPAGRGGELL